MHRSSLIWTLLLTWLAATPLFSQVVGPIERSRSDFIADSSQVEHLLSLSRQQTSLDSAFDFADQAWELALNTEWEVGKIKSSVSRGSLLRAKGQLDQAIKAYQAGLEIAERIGDDRGRGVLNNNLGVTYHDLETFNGDSSSLFVPDPFVSLSNLQPGRNYSIAIQAVSKGIESVERSIFQATRKNGKC